MIHQLKKWRPFNSNFSTGLQLHRVKQRDFNQRFSFKDYRVDTGHLGFYYNNYRCNFIQKRFIIISNGVNNGKYAFNRNEPRYDGFWNNLSFKFYWDFHRNNPWFSQSKSCYARCCSNARCRSILWFLFSRGRI